MGTNQIRNFHAVAPMGLGLVNDDWTLQLSCDAYSTAQTDALLLPKASESWVLAQLGGYSTTQQTSDAIAAALTNHFTRAEATANLVAFLGQANTYTDDQLGDYSTTAEMNQAISDALAPYGTIVQRDVAIAAALAAYYTSAQTDSAIAAAVATIDLTPYWTIAQVQAAITAALVPVTLSNGADFQSAPEDKRAEKHFGGRGSDGQLSKLGRHDPHRVGLVRPQRDLHAAGDGGRHNSCH